MFEKVFITVALLWGISEVAISTLLRSETEPARDAGTMKLVLIVAYASIGVAAFIGFGDDGRLVVPGRAAYVGLAMIVLGVIVRAYAIATLRHFFTVNVTIQEDHRLIRKGPYRWIRHPAYTGTLLSFYGTAVALQNAWAALILIVPITYAFFVRMQIEETVLRNAFPSDYPDYERATKRLVPFIY